MNRPYPKRVRIKQGWDEAGRTGTALAEGYVNQTWVMVLWDDEEDPDNYKAASLEEIPD
jgi:hypothetical protein